MYFNYTQTKLFFIFLLLTIFAFGQNTTVWNLTEDVKDPVKRANWVIFYQNGSTITKGDGSIAVLVDEDNNPSTTEIRLTAAQNDRVGAIWYNKTINLNSCGSWNVSFDFRAWETTSLVPADGLVFAFLKNLPTSPVSGGGLGMPINNEGFAFVFDTYANLSRNANRIPIIELREITSKNSYSEVQVPATGVVSILGGMGVAMGVSSHNIIRTSNYVTIKLVYNNGTLDLFQNLRWWAGGPLVNVPITSHPLSQSYLFPGYIYFSASTGASNEQHSIRNVKITLNKNSITNSARTTFICRNSPVNLDAGVGFDTYEWKKIGSNKIIGTTRLLNNISTEGTYTVFKSSSCDDHLDTIVVKNFGTIATNPLESQVDTTIFDPTTGNKNLEIYLCGTSGSNSSRALTINNNEASEIRWFKGTTLLTTGKNLTVNSAGKYKVEIEFKSPTGVVCISDFSFEVFKSNLSPTHSLELSSCNNGKLNKITILNAPNCEFSLNGINYQSSNEFILQNIDSNYTAYIKGKIGGCIYTITNILVKSYQDLNLNISPNHQECFDINDADFVIKITGGKPPFNLYQKLNNGPFTLFKSAINIDSIYVPAPNISSPSDSYIFKIEDDAGCNFESDSIAIIKNDPLKFNIDIKNPSCNKIDDAKITISNITGGTPPYRYSIDGGITFFKDTVFSNLISAPGIGTKYSVVAIDTNNCISNKSDFFIVKPNSDTISERIIIPSCFEGNDGSIEVFHPIGYDLRYSIDSTNYQSHTSFKNLIAGNYTLYIKDTTKPGACIITKNIIVNNPTKVSATITPNTSLTCSTDEIIEVKAIGGKSPYYFSFDGGYQYNSDSIFSYHFAGKFPIFVKDSYGCISDTIIHTVVNTASFESLKLNIGSNGICPGDIENTSIIDIVTTGSYPNIDSTVVLDSIKIFKQPATHASDLINMVIRSNTIPSFNVSDTTHVKFVVYNNGCTFTIDTVIIPKLPLFSLEKIQDISCRNGNDGKIALRYDNFHHLLNFPLSIVVENVSDSSLSPTNSLIFNSISDSIIENLYAGQYKITVTDKLGCASIFLGREVLLIQPSSSLKIDYITVTSPTSCHNNGSIEVDAVGGWGSFNYRLINKNTNDTIVHFQNSKIFSRLDTGTYYAQVIDFKGCLAEVLNTRDITLTRIDTFSIAKTFNNPLCFNSNNGNISISVPNIKLPANYKLEGPVSIDYTLSSSDTISYYNLPPGNYKIFVKDYYNCELIDSIAINGPSELIIDSISRSKDIICYGDLLDIEVHAHGGNIISGNYQYNMQKNGSPASAWQNSSIFTNLDSGSYIFSVKDINDCEKYIEYNIIPPYELILDTLVKTSNIFCIGDNTASIKLSNVYGGQMPYKTRLLKNGVLVSSTFNINKFSYSDLNVGNYYIELQDALGCTKYSNSISFVDPPVLVIDSLDVSNLDCNGGTSSKLGIVEAFVSGGTPPYQYNIGSTKWVDINKIEFLNAGNYVLTVRDANGCSLSQNFTITEPPALTLSLTSTKDLNCRNSNNGMVLFSAKGGVPPYEIKFESFVPAFSYSDTINNPNNNTISDTIKNLMATSFGILTLTDSKGCSSVINNISIIQPSTDITYSLDSVRVKCHNDSNAEISIKNISGGWSNQYEYSLFDLDSNIMIFPWSNTSTTFKNIPARNYLVGVKSIKSNDTLSCYSYKIVSLSNPLLPLSANTSIHSNDSIQCFGEEALITLNILGGELPYSVTDASGRYSNIVQNTSSHKYLLKAGNAVYFTVRDARGCIVNSNTIRNPEPSKITINNIDIESSLCYKPLLSVIVDNVSGSRGLYEYKFESIDGSHSVPYSNINSFMLKAGVSYNIYVKDRGFSCETFKTILVKGKDPLDFNIISSYNCQTLEYTITLNGKGGAPPYTYRVENSDGSTRTLTGNSFTCFDGNFKLFISDNNNCNNNSNPTLLERIKYQKLELFSDIGDGYINFWVKGGRSDVLIMSQSLRELVLNGNYGITWNKSDTIYAFDNRKNNDLSTNMDIYDSSFCSVYKFIEGIFPFEIPNFFTPDGDGVNDIFEVIYNGNSNLSIDERRYSFKREFPTAIIKIYNKNGILIFESKGKDRGWDGTLNGSPLPSDDYWCFIYFSDGQTIKGPVRLTR